MKVSRAVPHSLAEIRAYEKVPDEIKHLDPVKLATTFVANLTELEELRRIHAAFLAAQEEKKLAAKSMESTAEWAINVLADAAKRHSPETSDQRSSDEEDSEDGDSEDGVYSCAEASVEDAPEPVLEISEKRGEVLAAAAAAKNGETENGAPEPKTGGEPKPGPVQKTGPEAEEEMADYDEDGIEEVN